MSSSTMPWVKSYKKVTTAGYGTFFNCILLEFYAKSRENNP